MSQPAWTERIPSIFMFQTLYALRLSDYAYHKTLSLALASAAQRRVVRHGEVKPNSPMMEPISPSVCRSAKPNTKSIVKAVLIARAG
jgi:hypothetical protein